jgi:hypothetical protein
MDGHHSKSTQDRVRPSNMSADPPVGQVDRVVLVLTLVLHNVHSVAELLVKKVHKLAVEEALSSIMGAYRHNPPTLSMVWIPMSSSSSSLESSPSSSGSPPAPWWGT